MWVKTEGLKLRLKVKIKVKIKRLNIFTFNPINFNLIPTLQRSVAHYAGQNDPLKVGRNNPLYGAERPVILGAERPATWGGTTHYVGRIDQHFSLQLT